ncbi:hypothetical protein [Winogradskyella sp. Asnod2-B02-A]|uniref:hypothetical protein n=1 Tax=Winogradskyella sp. Asnod2-B02-A TaxID=3160583 RepID=UPI003863742C
MKNYIELSKSYLNILAVILLVFTTACNTDDAFTYDVPPQEATALINDVSFVVSSESPCRTDISISSSNFTNTIYYMFLSADADAPDSQTIFDEGTAVVPVNGAASITSGNLNPSTDYKAYFITLNNDGVRSAKVSEYNYSTPEFALNLSSSYVGTSVFVPNGASQEGYAVNVTPVAGMDNTYDLDVSWGDELIGIVCGGCVNPGDFPGPLRFSIDPVTYDITVLSGGESAGQGYLIDIAYVISGSGTYDICEDVISLDLLDESLFGESITVVLQ